MIELQFCEPRANELNSNDTQGHLLAGQIYWSLGDIDEAENILREALEGVQNYNPDFYGIAEIDDNGELIDEVEEVNL